MASLPPDPLRGRSLSDYAAGLRRGELTIEGTVTGYLQRIEVLDRHIGAFDHVDPEHALNTARALDQLLAAGTDLGPMMGVPIGIKDLLAVEGMPVRGGSKLEINSFVGEEGTLVKRLRAAGCVILGKTKTVEFAFGAVGISAPRGTPWNPADAETQRIPGGSSSGSAAAVGAGLCALAIGSDTGGSVRIPAALCGTVGLKTSDGRWPRDGVFALSPTLDTIGLLCRSVEDAELAFDVIDASPPAPPADLAGLRFGRPTNYYFDDLEPEVARRVGDAIARLQQAGATVVDIEVPEAPERETIFPTVLAPELLAGLGRDRFEAEKDSVDPLVRSRMEAGLKVPADTYIRAVNRRRELVAIAARRMTGLDAWLTPSVAVLAAPVTDFDDRERAMRLTMGITRNSQPGNMFAQCGLSIPVPGEPGALPVGLQIMAANGSDARLLAIGRAVERVLGRPQPHDLDAFASRR